MKLLKLLRLMAVALAGACVCTPAGAVTVIGGQTVDVNASLFFIAPTEVVVDVAAGETLSVRLIMISFDFKLLRGAA